MVCHPKRSCCRPPRDLCRNCAPRAHSSAPLHRRRARVARPAGTCGPGTPGSSSRGKTGRKPGSAQLLDPGSRGQHRHPCPGVRRDILENVPLLKPFLHVRVRHLGVLDPVPPFFSPQQHQLAGVRIRELRRSTEFTALKMVLVAPIARRESNRYDAEARAVQQHPEAVPQVFGQAPHGSAPCNPRAAINPCISTSRSRTAFTLAIQRPKADGEWMR